MIPISHSSRMSSNYMESEYDISISEEALTIAANALSIDTDQKSAALTLLKKRVKARPIRGTDYIEITAKDKDPAQAVKIANAVAEAYVQQRAALENSRAQRTLKALDEELDQQAQLVVDHRKDLETFMDHLKLSFPLDEKTFPLLEDTPSQPDTDSIQYAINQSTYLEEIESFTQSRAMLREMKIKQEEARILLKMPRNPVTIHQKAG